MPFSYTFFLQEKTVLLTAEGVVDFHSVAEVMEAVSSGPNYEPGYKIVVDLRQMKYRPHMQELFRLRDTLNSFKHKINGEITLVVKGGDTYTGRVFRTLAKAYDLEINITSNFEI